MKLFLGCSESLCDLNLLAQVGTPLLSRIRDDDCDHCNQYDDQEYFHAHRIARTLESVLYSGFANTKQLCNCSN